MGNISLTRENCLFVDNVDGSFDLYVYGSEREKERFSFDRGEVLYSRPEMDATIFHIPYDENNQKTFYSIDDSFFGKVKRDMDSFSLVQTEPGFFLEHMDKEGVKAKIFAKKTGFFFAKFVGDCPEIMCQH